MTLHPAAILIGIAMLAPARSAESAFRPSASAPWPALIVAQAADSTSPATDVPPSTTTAPPATSGNRSAPSASAPANGATSVPPRAPALTGATRNGAAGPAATQPVTGLQNSGPSPITFGGPQVDVQPVYGGTMRDSGAGNGGVPVYNNSQGTLGGPISGTATPYLTTLPYGSAAPGQTRSGNRAGQNPAGATSSTLQPLGAQPYTRDQNGTLGGRGGYTAQGVYNGTAAQTGVGYGSPYAPSGRPTGGLLSTNVDATGPLRPYIPLNNNTTGATNSGYGIPNGSRPSQMDGRGIQRVR